MFKKIAFGGIGLLFLVTPLFASAQSIADLQAQIQALLAQVVALQAQLAPQVAPAPSTSNAGYATSCLVLTNNLYVDIDDVESEGEVTMLQKFLAQDFSIYPEARITGYFGPATERAVKKWQAKSGVVSSGKPDTTGYGAVGPKTRAAMARGCGVAMPPQITTSGIVRPVVIPSEPVVPAYPSTAPNLTVSNVYAGTVNVNYANLPVNSQLVFVNATTRERFGAQSSMISGGGGGSISISELPDMPQTLYFLRAQDYATGAAVAESSAFLLGSKQTGAVACSLTADKAAYKLGETITFSWNSKNATRAEWIDDTDKDNIPLPTGIPGLSGSTLVSANTLGNPYVVLRVYGPGGTATCTKSVPVGEIAPQVQATPALSVSPASGSAPLTVTFTYTMNAEGWCDQRYYVLNFGDETDKNETRLLKPQGTCQAYTQYSQHTYTKAGTYSASLVAVDVPNVPNRTLGTATVTANVNSQTSLTFTSPTGGTYRSGDIVKISWTMKSPRGYVYFSLISAETGTPLESDFGASIYQATAQDSTNVTLTTGAKHYIPSGRYKIRATVRDGDNAAVVYAGSDSNVITISSDESITVTAPNGGEQWEIGTLNTVTWTPYQYNPDINPARDVTAYLERYLGEKENGEKVFETLGKVEESGKASIHWSGGELNSATQGGVFVKPGQYYIRIVNNVTGSSDRSDAPFTLLPRPITMLVNGSDKYVALNDVNQPITVSWTTNNNLYNCQLSGINEVSFSTIQPSYGSVTGRIAYQSAGEGISYGVTLQCVRNVNGVPTQVSANAPFYVNYIPSPASLQVTSPNGGEQFKADGSGSTLVQWKSAGIKSASVALYKNDTWAEWIAKDVATAPTSPAFLNMGSDTYGVNWNPYTRTDLATAGNVFKIYITGQKADGTGYVDDKSDAPFSFVNPVPTGSYLAYMNGYLKATSENITEADALANCKLNAANNPGWLHHCRWNNKIIYSDTQVTLQYPNGGQSFVAGSGNSVTVTWNASGVPGGSTICTVFKPDGSAGGGFAFPGSGSCTTATSGAGAHTGTLIRNSGYDLAPGTYHAVVTIVGPSDGGKDGQTLAEDESDSTFTLTGSSASTSTNSNLANVLTAMESILRSLISKLSSP